jgi:hypothetical protein
MSSSTSTTINNINNNKNNTFVVRYRWIVDLINNDPKSWFVANSSREYVRIMGTIVAIQDIPKEDVFLEPLFLPLIPRLNYCSSSNPLREVNSYTKSTTNHKLLTLDDGTDIISIWTCQSMIDELIQLQLQQQQHHHHEQQQQQQQPNEDSNNDIARSMETKANNHVLLLGLTLDCIIKLRQTSSHRRWFAETLIPLHHATQLEEEEQLRWILLSHQQKHYIHPNNTTSTTTRSEFPSMYSHDYGFPTRRHDSAKLYHLINVHAQIQKKAYDRRQQKENKWLFEKRRFLHEKRRRSSTTTTSKSGNIPWSKNSPAATITPTLGNNNGNSSLSKGKKIGQSSLATSIPTTTCSKLQQQQQPLVLKGLTLDDLTCVMQQSQQVVQTMIEELQMEGRVYRNHQGEYLPL